MYYGKRKCERKEGGGVEPARGCVSSCTIAGVTDGDVFRRDGEGLGGSP